MSFDNGMRMGMDAWDSAQEAKLREKEAERRKILDDRATVEWDQRQAEGARARSKQERVDGLNDQLTRPNLGNYSLETGSAPGLSSARANPPAATGEVVDPTAPIALGAQREPGLSMDAPSAPGLSSAKLQAPQGGYTTKELPTRGAAEDILGQIALAKDDHSAYRAAMTAKRTYDFQDGIAQHTKAFQSMAPEAKTALMEKFTSDQGIPLNMVPSSGMGKDGRPTYTTWVEGKPRIQLSEDEVSQLYAASQLMGTHPDLARAQLEKGSDKVRSLFKDYYSVADKTMDTNNQAVTQGGLIDAKTAAQRTAEIAAQAKAAAAATGKPLPGSVVKSLQEARDNATTINTLATTFKDDFASKGVLGMGAEASMSAKGVLGTDKEAVDWWKNYRKQAELVERHSMFGAALTPGEQASWRSADIGPGMDKDVIKKNLETRAKLTQKVLDNTRQDQIDAGHNEGRVTAIASRGAGAQPAGSIPPNVAKVTSPAEAMKLPPGTVFVDTNGVTRRRP